MKKILFIVLGLVILILSFLTYNGLFREIHVVEKEVPGYSLMTLDFKGPYHQIGETFERLKSTCEQHNIKQDFIGIYFDNPDEVAEEDLRSKACVIVNSGDSAKLAALGCSAYQLPAGSALTVDWHYTNGIEMLIGIFKSYATLGEYSATLNCRDQVGHVYERYVQDGVEFVFLKDKKE